MRTAVGDAGPCAPVRATLASLLSATRRVDSARSRDEVASALLASLRDCLSFGAIAVSLVDVRGDLVVAAADGPPELVSLRGHVIERAAVDSLLADADAWGSLRFARSPSRSAADRTSRPGAQPGDGAADDPWRPGDVLLAPMLASDGRLVGVVSVDRPADGLLPSTERCLVLELVAEHATAVIDRCPSSRGSGPAYGPSRACSGPAAAYREAFEQAPVGIAVLDATLSVLSANDAFARTVGTTRRELAGAALADVVDEADAYLLLDACREACEQPGTSDPVEHRFASRDGPGRWARSWATAVPPDDTGRDGPLQVVLTSCDVTEERRARAEQGARATRDALTGLGNRRAALARVGRALDDRRAGESVALVVVDVDGLSDVNDAHGRNAGDAVLLRTCELLSSMLRSGEELYRFGGDELAVVCEHVRGARAAEALAARLASVRPSATGRLGEFSCALRAAVAVSGDDEGATSVASLVAAANDALERSRRTAGRPVGSPTRGAPPGAARL